MKSGECIYIGHPSLIPIMDDVKTTRSKRFETPKGIDRLSIGILIFVISNAPWKLTLSVQHECFSFVVISMDTVLQEKLHER